MKGNNYLLVLKIYFFIFFIFFSLKAIAQENDVRMTSWGMTKDQIINAEGRQPENIESSDNDEILDYNLVLDNRNVLCTYHLLNGRLYKVVYRYYWGKWQNDLPKDFSSRKSSLYTFFQSLDKKNYKLTSGWYVPQERYSQIGDDLGDCLGIYQKIKPFDNLAYVENCFNKISNERSINGPILYADINYENDNTKVTLSFPLKNHEFKNTILCWVEFESKKSNKFNQSDF